MKKLRQIKDRNILGLVLNSEKSARQILLDIKLKLRDLQYVHRIVHLFLGLKARQIAEDQTLKLAKLLARNPDDKRQDSKIDKIWEPNAAAAPYIYAFFPDIAEALSPNLKPSLRCADQFLRKLVMSGNLLEKLGVARFAADALPNKSIKRPELEGVVAREPTLPIITEAQVVAAKNAAEVRRQKDDGKPYRTKSSRQ